MKPEWRDVLNHRSVEDKIGIAIDCDMAPVGSLNIVAELVREGIMVWVDRTTLRHLGARHSRSGEVRLGINADVYQLTLKGIKLCNEHGIKRQ